jgi:hypothetical protein
VAEEGDLMAGDLEAGWDKRFDPFHTFFKIEDRVAFLAVKVMMVPLVRSFVAGRLSRNLNATNQTLILEGFQGSVDGGDPQGGN